LAWLARAGLEHFLRGADASGETELRCKYRSASGWGADAIVRGVDSFQVLYGVDTDTPPDGVPNTYLNATAVQAIAGWKRVCSIKLALLLHGERNTRSDTVDARYDLFGPAYSDAHGEDLGVRVVESSLPPSQRLRARRLFSMTVALRNRDG
jgi:type IV pilus assembly protein PilW